MATLVIGTWLCFALIGKKYHLDSNIMDESIKERQETIQIMVGCMVVENNAHFQNLFVKIIHESLNH